jgi:predicted GNAT family acetyltransferase
VTDAAAGVSRTISDSVHRHLDATREVAERTPRHPARPRPGVGGRAYPDGVTELRFTHEPDASRYTLHRGDDLVSVLDYRDDGRTVAMTRAYTVPTFRGHGYAGELVDRAVAELERSGSRTVIPVCWYVADWFAAHPGRSGILAGRRSA